MPRTKKTVPAARPSTPAAQPAKGALSVKETCAFLSVSRNTLYRLQAVGELRPIYILAKPAYRMQDLQDFLARCAENAEIPA